ncbi:MAG: FtsX-like permease family protein, partial [Pseudomonadota bacterium]
MSGFATVVATLASHWWRRPGQFLALIAGLAAATALWSGVQALNAEARASYDRAAAVLGGDRFETVVMAEGGPMPLARFATLRRAGWDVSPVLDGRWRVGGRSFRLLGVEPLSLPDDALGASEIGEGERLAAFLTPPYPLIAAPETAAELPRSETGADIGEVIEDPAMPPGILIADIARAEELLRRPGEIDRLLVVARGAPLAEITPDLTLRPPEEEGDLARLTDSFHLNLTAFGLLSFVVGLFIVHATVGLAFEQRRATVRTLRAVGVGRAELTLALVVELLVIAAMGAALGMALGYLIAAVLIGDVAASLRGLYGASVPGELSLRPAWWLAGAGMAVAGTFAAAANGVWKLRRMPVLAAAHVEAWHSAERLALRRQGALALALALIAGAALLFGEGLVAGFALMGGVLMAAALALPLALAFLLQVLQARTKGPVGEWIVAEGRAQLGGLSLALMALLLALSVNIGVGAMVSSFRETFLGYLDQRLAADLYLRGKTEAEAADIAALLTARDDVIAVLPIQSVTLERDGYPYDLFGLTDDPMYRENWPLLSAGPDPWGALASGEGIMISEQFSRAQGLALGDRLHPGGTGTAWTPQVVAIFPDYGNPVGQAMTSTSMLTARWPEVE